MRRYIFIVLLILPNILFAQQNYKIQGKVLDENSASSIPFVTITVMRDSAFVTGSISDRNGKFEVLVNDTGDFQIQLSYLGYKTLVKDIKVNAAEPAKLGEISMKVATEELDEVIVRGHKNLREEDLEAKIYRVSDNIASKGGSLADFMQTVPGVAVNMDGEIKLRGSDKIGFYIDGQPSALFGADRTAGLKQIPAASIERIEVITNPSAKYDPDGMAGIINIVFKEEKREGLNGEAKFTYGYDDIYMPSISLNYRKKNLNVFGTFDGTWKEYQNHNEFYDRSNERTGESMTQKYVTDEPFNSQVYRIGADYTFGKFKNNTLTIYTQYEDEYEENIGNIKYKFYDSIGNFTSAKTRNLVEKEFNDVVDLALKFKHDFAKKERKLDAGIIYSSAKEREKYTFDEDITDVNHIVLTPDDVYERTTLENTNTTFNVYANFSQQFREKGRLELGYKSIVRTIDVDHRWYNLKTDTLQQNSGRRNYDFQYSEQVHSVYALVKEKVNKFNYEIGARFEQVYTESEEGTTSFNFSKDYFRVYPSVKMGYELSGANSVLFSYSGRVNRPDFEDLNIVPKYIDPLNLFVGNYDLDPEYVHTAELGYDQNWKKFQIIVAGFFKYINNPIYPVIEIHANDVAEYYPENHDFRVNTGGEVILNLEVFRWWIVNCAVDVYDDYLAESTIYGTPEKESVSVDGKFNSLFTLRKGFKFQVNGWYNSSSFTPQGQIGEQYAFDLTADQSLFKNRGNIFIRVTDVLDTLERKETFTTGNTTVVRTDNHETRFFYVGFKYKFNL